jgi:hypothetical protein
LNRPQLSDGKPPSDRTRTEVPPSVPNPDGPEFQGLVLGHLHAEPRHPAPLRHPSMANRHYGVPRHRRKHPLRLDSGPWRAAGTEFQGRPNPSNKAVNRASTRQRHGHTTTFECPKTDQHRRRPAEVSTGLNLPTRHPGDLKCGLLDRPLLTRVQLPRMSEMPRFGVSAAGQATVLKPGVGRHLVFASAFGGERGPRFGSDNSAQCMFYCIDSWREPERHCISTSKNAERGFTVRAATKSGRDDLPRVPFVAKSSKPHPHPA